MLVGGWAGASAAPGGTSIGRGLPSPPREALWDRFLRKRGWRLRNVLAEVYRGVVRETLRHLRPRPPRDHEGDDLESAGAFGLLRAVERFDPGRGVRFETFAGRWVRGAILEEVRRSDPWPRRWRARAARLEAAAGRLRERLHREPTDAEVARALGVSLERYGEEYARLRGRELPRAPLSLGEGGACRVAEGLVAEEDSPFERVSRRDLLDLAFSLLDARERAILRLRYYEDATMREIGERVGLHESRVCRIHAQALERLRTRLASRAWEAA